MGRPGGPVCIWATGPLQLVSRALQEMVGDEKGKVSQGLGIEALAALTRSLFFM